MDSKELLEQRRAKDEFFASHHHSPLSHELRHGFEGLDYFVPDSSLVFEVMPEPADGGEVTIQTSDGRERIYRRAGTARFSVDGSQVELTLYDTGHAGYFVPFRDETSGKTTYGAGRYLDIEPNDNGTVTIDFNQAYNPFCAYNEAYSCPLPPVQNWLRVPIEAGEKDFKTA